MKRRAPQTLALDHRGRPCELIDPTSNDLPWELKEALPAPGMRGKGFGAEFHWTLICGWGVIVAGAIVILALMPSSWGWFAPAVILVLAPVGTIVALVFRPFSRSWRRAAADAIIETTLGFNLCPGCGYTLEDLTPADDGCLECPECGAAWRADSVPKPKPTPAQPL